MRLSAVGAGHVLGCERALLDPPAPVSRARNAASSVAPPAVIRHCETAIATTNLTALVMRVGGGAHTAPLIVSGGEDAAVAAIAAMGVARSLSPATEVDGQANTVAPTASTASIDLRQRLPPRAIAALAFAADAMRDAHAARLLHFTSNDALQELLVSAAGVAMPASASASSSSSSALSPSRHAPIETTGGPNQARRARLLAAVAAAPNAAAVGESLSSPYEGSISNSASPYLQLAAAAAAASASSNPQQQQQRSHTAFVSPATLAGTGSAFPFTALQSPSAAHARMVATQLPPRMSAASFSLSDSSSSSPPHARPHHAFPYSAALPADPFRSTTPSPPNPALAHSDWPLSNLADSHADAAPSLTGPYLDSADRPFSADAATHAYWTHQRALLDAEAGEVADPRFSTGTAHYL